MDLVGSSMDAGHPCVGVGSDSGLLVRISPIAQLDDLADKDSFGVGRIRTYTQLSVSLPSANNLETNFTLTTEECSEGGRICDICATKDFSWTERGDGLGRVIEHIGINNYLLFIIDLIKIIA